MYLFACSNCGLCFIARLILFGPFSPFFGGVALHEQHCKSFSHPERAELFQNPQQFTTRGALTQGIQSRVPNPMRQPTSAAFIALPYCDCLPCQPATRRTVTKEGGTTGRTFYTCRHKRDSNGNCGFFEWGEENVPSSPGTRSPPMRKKKKRQAKGPGQAHKRPKGRSPKGKTWDAAMGMWVVEDTVAAAAAAEAMARVEERESALLDVPMTFVDDDDQNRAAVAGSWRGPPAAVHPADWRQATVTTAAMTPQARAAIERQTAAAALAAVQAFSVAGGGGAWVPPVDQLLGSAAVAAGPPALGGDDSNALVECRHCEDFVDIGELDGHERACPSRPQRAAEDWSILRRTPCILCSLPILASMMNDHVNACLDKSQ